MKTKRGHARMTALAGALGGLVFMAAPAAAQSPPPAADSWSFTLSPYVWFSGLSGEVTTRAGTESFAADFGDIFGTMKFSAMGLAEARRGNVSLLLDTFYINLQQGVPVPGHGGYSGASARTRSAQVAAIGLYTLAEGQSSRLEIGGGVRAWWFDTELTLDAGRLPGRSVDNSTNWVDPIIAARGALRLTDTLSFTAYGDVGGFGVGSEFTWQVMATLDWSINDRLSVSAGYRHVHIDYEKSNSTIGMEMSGPIIGASYRF